jgi:hypothetical protein
MGPPAGLLVRGPEIARGRVGFQFSPAGDPQAPEVYMQPNKIGPAHKEKQHNPRYINTKSFTVHPTLIHDTRKPPAALRSARSRCLSLSAVAWRRRPTSLRARSALLVGGGRDSAPRASATPQSHDRSPASTYPHTPGQAVVRPTASTAARIQRRTRPRTHCSPLPPHNFLILQSFY